MTEVNILLGILGVLNLIALFVVASDKRQSMARGTAERTPEGLLFFMAAAFGALGVYVGMVIFRHKTKKWYFMLGIPLLIVQNLATLYTVSELFLIREF